MKKILLIIAVVLCVAIAGTALAATVKYYNPDDISGTLAADTYVELSLDGTQTAEITLVGGQFAVRKVQCNVSTSATNEANGTLKVSLNAANNKTLAGVTVALYADANCNTPVLDDEDQPLTQTGAGFFEKEGINATTPYYVKVSFAGAADAAALAAIGGTLKFEFTQA